MRGRAWLFILGVAAVVAAPAREASAHRLICEPEEPPWADEPRMTFAPAPAPAPRPLDPRMCLPGAPDDPCCRPALPVPSPARTGALVFTQPFVLLRLPALVGPGARRLARGGEGRSPLAPGHARRVERPPRSA